MNRWMDGWMDVKMGQKKSLLLGSLGSLSGKGALIRLKSSLVIAGEHPPPPPVREPCSMRFVHALVAPCWQVSLFSHHCFLLQNRISLNQRDHLTLVHLKRCLNPHSFGHWWSERLTTDLLSQLISLRKENWKWRHFPKKLMSSFALNAAN